MRARLIKLSGSNACPAKAIITIISGKSNKKAFLKSPLEFTRVSSGFATRVHPVTGNIRQHQRHRFCRSDGNPDPRGCRRYNQFLGMAKRLRQLYRFKTLGCIFHCLRTYEPHRSGYVQRQKGKSGRHHRIRWINRPQYRPTSSL